MTDDDSDSNGDGNVNAVDEETYDGRDVYNDNGNSDDQIIVNIYAKQLFYYYCASRRTQ